MALPSFPTNLNDLQSGTVGRMAATLSKIQVAKVLFDQQISGVDNYLKGLSELPGLPDLPSIPGISAQVTVVQQQVSAKLLELDEISQIGGSCLAGPMAALTAMTSDGFGLVSNALEGFNAVLNMPSEMMGIYGLYARARNMIGALGVDKLVAAALGQLGCLSDSSMIADTTAELAQIMNAFGMDGTGQITDESFQAKMAGDLSASGAMHGIDPAFTTNMSNGLGEMGKQANIMTQQATAKAQEVLAGIKENAKLAIQKKPSPPALW
jgi:hypothetical protein